jgi:type II secretory pathway pseudopilin PulG
MIRINEKNRKAFTLIETIVASIILCGSVLAVSAISSRSMVSTKLNRQYEVAAQLANRQLVLIDYLGIEDFIQLGQTEGDFEKFEKQYYWQALYESLEIDNLYNVTVIVTWVERNKPYSVMISTRINGTGQLIELEYGETEEGNLDMGEPSGETGPR